MPPTLEDRVQELERFRYAALGRINACNTLVINSLVDLILRHSPDPIATAERMTKAWIETAAQPNRTFAGAEPAHPDVVSQEYERAIRDLSKEILGAVRAMAPTLGRPDR